MMEPSFAEVFEAIEREVRMTEPKSLGQVAYEAYRMRDGREWPELSMFDQDAWQQVAYAVKIASRIRDEPKLAAFYRWNHASAEEWDRIRAEDRARDEAQRANPGGVNDP